MKLIRIVVAILCVTSLAALRAGYADEPAQRGGARLDDALLQNMIGSWKVSRRIRGTVVGNTLEAEWVLQHQFVQLHMKDVTEPSQYEALVLIGFDSNKNRYVAYWCDSLGAQYSGVGYGARTGNVIEFTFNYPDGPFHNTFSWKPDGNTWSLLMEAEGKDGTRTFFAEDTLRRK